MYYCKECGIPLHDDDNEFTDYDLMKCIVCKKIFRIIDDDVPEGVLIIHTHTLNKAVEQLLEAAIPIVMAELKTVRELNVIQERKLSEVGYGHFHMQDHFLKEAEKSRDAWWKRTTEAEEKIELLKAENQRLVNEINNQLLAISEAQGA